MRRLSFLAFVLFGTLPSFVFANTLTAVKIISGDELTLNDGRTVRLEGIKVPKEFADRADTQVQASIGNRSLALENPSIDRYGRTAAQVYATDDKKLWLQGELLRAGLAFVYPPIGDEPHIDEMLKLETEARHAHRGIWADPVYADMQTGDAKNQYGSFAFVIGKVLETERVKNMVYLNFGPDWRTDFTIAIAAHDLHNFRKNGIDPLLYKDKTVRIRGWIKRDYGPMITATSPAQIQVPESK